MTKFKTPIFISVRKDDGTTGTYVSHSFVEVGDKIYLLTGEIDMYWPLSSVLDNSIEYVMKCINDIKKQSKHEQQD